MSLPITDETMSYTTVELLSGKKIGIRPWRVREERELLFAVEGQDDEADIRKEIVKMISKCVDNQDVFNSLSNVDYVFLLAQLRKLSKGPKIEYTYKCSKCKFELIDEADLNKHLTSKQYTGGTVQINKDVSVVLKEVSFRDYDLLQKKYEKTSEYNFNYTLKSIDTVIINGEVYSDLTMDELTKYVDTFSSNEYKVLSKAIDEALPSIELKKVLTCKRCNTDNDIDFGDLYYFLGF